MDQNEAVIYKFPMAVKTRESSPTEEAGATPLETTSAIILRKDSSRPFLRAAQRELTEQEAASPAGLRWLAYDVERLEQDCRDVKATLSTLREKFDALTADYHNKRVELETLRASSRTSLKIELLSYWQRPCPSQP